jgi:hypothetical protein
MKLRLTTQTYSPRAETQRRFATLEELPNFETTNSVLLSQTGSSCRPVSLLLCLNWHLNAVVSIFFAKMNCFPDFPLPKVGQTAGRGK